jgi:uncharacterized repeat protein (TIGR02543 family)
VDVSPAEGGTIEINKTAFEFYPNSMTLDNGEVVSLEAIPAPGYGFTEWNGNLSGNENPAMLTMDCTKSVTAIFFEKLPELTISIKGKGTTSPEAGTLSYDPGTTITITAIPDDGWQFDGWTGDVPESESALIVITVEANKNITANFSQTTPNQSLYIFIIAGIIACGIIAWLIIRSQTGK